MSLKTRNKPSFEYLFMSKDLSVWFYSLELEQLARIFNWEDGWDANEFIDQCDEWWQDADAAEREWFYQKYNGW